MKRQQRLRKVSQVIFFTAKEVVRGKKKMRGEKKLAACCFLKDSQLKGEQESTFSNLDKVVS